jgi:hypothetical protein
VRPIHVFTAVADPEGQKEWNPQLKIANILKEDQAQMARGVKLQYTAGPGLADRKVYEWEVFSQRGDGEEYWYAASTWANDMLKDLDRKPNEGAGFFGINKPVEAHNCLAAHRIRATKDGVYAAFTNSVNGHPPLGLSVDWVSKLTWSKTVGFVNDLRKRAALLAQMDDAELWKPPAGMMPSQEPQLKPQSCGPLLDGMRTALEKERALPHVAALSPQQKNQELADIQISRAFSFFGHSSQAARIIGGAVFLSCVSMLLLIALRLRASSTSRVAVHAHTLLSTLDENADSRVFERTQQEFIS